ncbi:hypothetical protein R9C00_20490 [Flammeovirgaceae bacterium SG7u.111]|nr:hypothetical protein [Flammeovirgaceae bacterium SG7u.132]WPO34081.1 hypothetical protein R9C00_20490 [Flammeovirgaceae bacterium SG7u.111]
MNRFLKAKHWQLFLLFFGVPFIFQVLMMGSIFSQIGNDTSEPLLFIFNFLSIMPILMILMMGVLFGWFWSVVIGLQKYLPEGVTIKMTRFKVFFFIPIIYILFFTTSFSIMFFNISGIVEGASEPPFDPSLIFAYFGIIMPLHLFSMFCIFHTIYQAAKVFKAVELQREVKFSDFAGEFFMIWFFYVGIWIIQPKVNKMVAEEHGTNL